MSSKTSSRPTMLGCFTLWLVWERRGVCEEREREREGEREREREKGREEIKFCYGGVQRGGEGRRDDSLKRATSSC